RRQPGFHGTTAQLATGHRLQEEPESSLRLVPNRAVVLRRAQVGFRKQLVVNASLPVAPLLGPVFGEARKAKVFEKDLEFSAGLELNGDDVRVIRAGIVASLPLNTRDGHGSA